MHFTVSRRYSETARAIARPSSVEVPRPTSSMITKERTVAARRIFAVSIISTRKVDSPFARLSLAPTRQKIRSTIPMRAFTAGIYEPVWARSTINAFCLKYVLLPAMLGPVIKSNEGHPSLCSALIFASLGTNSPPGRCASTTGCLPSVISKTVELSI